MTSFVRMQNFGQRRCYSSKFFYICGFEEKALLWKNSIDKSSLSLSKVQYENFLNAFLSALPLDHLIIIISGSSGKAFVSKTVGLMFDSRAGQLDSRIQNCKWLFTAASFHQHKAQRNDAKVDLRNIIFRFNRRFPFKTQKKQLLSSLSSSFCYKSVHLSSIPGTQQTFTARMKRNNNHFPKLCFLY